MAPFARLAERLPMGGIRPLSFRSASPAERGADAHETALACAARLGVLHCFAIVLLAVSVLGAALIGTSPWDDDGSSLRKRLPVAAEIGAKGLSPTAPAGKKPGVIRSDRQGGGDPDAATVAVRRLVSSGARWAEIRSGHCRSVSISTAAGFCAGGRIPTGPPPGAA